MTLSVVNAVSAVSVPASSVAGALIERADLLARLDACAADGSSVLLYGPPGVGRTALLDELARRAVAGGALVLRSASVAGEVQLPYLALIDLLDDVVAEVEGLLPEHFRLALRMAMLRDLPPPDAPVDPLAVRMAVVEALRCLAASRPLLVLLDDIQWLDEASCRVLEFALRRMAGRQIMVVAAERTDEAPAGDILCLPNTVDLRVGGLSEAGVARLLAQRSGKDVTGLVLRRVFQATGGNPLLAIELSRACQDDPVEDWADDPSRPLTVSRRLRGLVASALSEVPPAACHALLLLSAARHATELPAAALQTLRHAVGGRIVRWGPDGRPRFAQPMLGEIVYADAVPDARRRAHRALARLATDPVEQARHLAHAAPAPTAAIGETLVRAAETALQRAAPGTAAELLRLAARHTPGDSTTSALRLLAAAQHAAAAGQVDFALTCAKQLLDAPAADVRVRARLLTARVLSHNHPDKPALIAAALRETDASDAAICSTHVEAAVHALQYGNLAESHACLDRAQEHVAGDDQGRLEILALRAYLHLLTASPESTAMFEEGRQLSVSSPVDGAAVQVRRGLATAYLRSGHTRQAMAEIELLRAELERSGRADAACDILHIAATIHERAGHCAKAQLLYLAAADMFPLTETGVRLADVFAAAAELNTGSAGHAVTLIEEAIGSIEAVGDLAWLSYAHCLRGRAHLIEGDTTQAVQHLGLAASLLRELRFHDPALLLLDADLAEALALTGQTEESCAVIVEARERAERHERHVVVLGLDRADAVLTAVSDPRRAADQLRAALPQSHPYPLEVARSQLVLGKLEHRNRRRASARTDLRAAGDAFRHAGCTPWLSVAETALRAVDPAETVLSTIQQEIVDLACAGLTNRQMANRLHLSVKAVEAHLTRIYRRHGVSGRLALVQFYGD
ncbi:AAA family ATPase [Micromonospora sp. CA-111912]|uniref:AAA family ATPase n=1 Tax=Micromonospora sp. CA-111912 TaxID=3239955 RepID=UPI003D9282D3